MADPSSDADNQATSRPSIGPSPGFQPGLSDRETRYIGPDEATYQGGKLLHNLLLFGRLCKGLGLDVTTERMLDVGRALQWLNLGRRQEVHDAMQAILVSRQQDIAIFDAAFDQFWRAPSRDEWTTLDLKSMGETRRQKKTQFLPPLNANPDDESDDAKKPAIDNQLVVVVPTYSEQEILRNKDFAEMTPKEVAQARQLMARLGWSLGRRRTRHFIPGKGGALDPRSALRRNLRYGGDLIELPERVRKVKPRPIVLICDISGSMERYTRLFLHFMHTLAGAGTHVESFVFATRLSRISRAIHRRSVEVALREAGTVVKDWGGGTRTGDALHTFNYRWGRRVLHHGAVVLLITDGWDRGDPELLSAEAARLQRNCYRLIWLNPLLGAPQYEPLTRGAQSLLPNVDDFLAVDNLASLETLARELGRVDWRRPERGHTRAATGEL